MLWKKKGVLEEVAPSSPTAIQLGVYAIKSYRELVVLPNDPISQDFQSKVESLANEATTNDEQAFEKIATTLNQVVSGFGESQRKAIEKSLEATHAGLREVLLSLDGAVNSSEALEKTTEGSASRMRSLQDLKTYDEVVKGLQQEVEILTKAINEHKESARAIRKVCTQQIDELRSKLRVAERSVRTDHLTKLSNRSAFDFMLSTAIGKALHGEEYHLAILDLNNFKQINDAHGHTVGDAALTLFAQKLNETFGLFGSNCTQVARLGGDEFAVVFKGTELQLKAKLERVNSILEKNPMQSKGAPFVLSASYGLVRVRANHTLEAAYHEADVKMYEFKRASKAA